ncbi:MAG: TetR/AcrR family transcriptional regulator [Methanobacteriaceae archaeon]|nr:TetR/AcrR family transcriptional regulator [Methanobacteriaceae archaeon]
MTIISRKQREKEMRRRNILQSAEKLFYQKGYEKVTMNEIAQETELARSTLYLYFKNKEEIYLAITLKGSEILKEILTKNFEKGQNGLEKIEMLTKAFIKFYTEYPLYYLSRFYYQVPFNQEYQKIDDLNKIRTESFVLVVKAFQEGIDDGTLQTDQDPVKSALILSSLIQNVLNLTPTTKMHMETYGITHDELIDYTIDFIIKSVQNYKKTNR